MLAGQHSPATVQFPDGMHRPYAVPRVQRQTQQT